jgi:hypothetical protein
LVETAGIPARFVASYHKKEGPERQFFLDFPNGIILHGAQNQNTTWQGLATVNEGGKR